MKKARFKPTLDRLEKRDVPATWGVPWPDAQHLTLSFVPDGTSIQGQPSQLFQKLDAQLGAGKWESSILNAFQSWAQYSNLNIGVVPDGGQPEGTMGPAQGDPRFGDIRISAAPLPEGVVAITSPYDPGTGTTSGDMILNSSADFSPRGEDSYDLFTVALHEAGHSFGFADSQVESSFMFDEYRGRQTGLIPSAIPAIQSLYGGPRNIAGMVGESISSDPGRPVNVSPAHDAVPGTSATLVGDLAATRDANYFQYKAPDAAAMPLGVDFQVQTSGISLLIPRITITDPLGKVVAQGAAASSMDGGVSIHLDKLASGQTYTIKVAGATGDLDSIGSYELTIGSTTASDTAGVSLDKATPIGDPTSFGLAPATVGGSISARSQLDYYRFTTPATLAQGVIVQLQAYGIGLIAPQVTVYNAKGNKVLGSAVAVDPTNAVATVYLGSASPSTTYLVKVGSGVRSSHQFGNYQVSVAAGAPSSAPTVAPLMAPWLGSADAHIDHPNVDLKSAAQLKTPAGYEQGTFYAAMAGISGAGDAQFYQLKMPRYDATAYMTVAVQALGSSGLHPWISVYDRDGNPLTAQVLAGSGGTCVLQVPYTKDGDAILRVSASQADGGNSRGNYYLSTSFGLVASSLSTLASGPLGAAPAGAATPGVAATLTTPSAGLYQFVLSGSSANLGTDAILRMTVTDASGKVVATLTSSALEAASSTVMLAKGKYSILIDAYSPSGKPIRPLAFQLSGTNLTDPIKVYSSSGAGTTPPR